MRRILTAVSCCLVFSGVHAFATPVFDIVTGTLTASRLISGSGEIDDVRGLVNFDVLDPGLLGGVTITDSTGGTDPNFLTLPFGNDTLTGLNNGLTQETSITFNFSTSIIGPSNDTITAIGTAVIPNPTSDPALADTDQSLVFTFDLASITNPSDGVTLAQYNLASISAATAATPEPAYGAAIGLAAMLLFGYLRLRRRAV